MKNLKDVDLFIDPKKFNISTRQWGLEDRLKRNSDFLRIGFGVNFRKTKTNNRETWPNFHCETEC